MQETAAIFDGGYQLTLWPETPGFESGVFGPASRQGAIADHAVCMQSVVCLDQGRSAEIIPCIYGNGRIVMAWRLIGEAGQPDISRTCDSLARYGWPATAWQTPPAVVI